jgi:hypothetical protein
MMDLAVPDSSEISVGPTGRDLEFGRTRDLETRTNTKLATLEKFLNEWSFPSWVQQRATCFSATSRRAGSWKTIRLTPPRMIEQIEPQPSAAGKTPGIKLSARQGPQLLKWFKSHEVS